MKSRVEISNEQSILSKPKILRKLNSKCLSKNFQLNNSALKEPNFNSTQLNNPTIFVRRIPKKSKIEKTGNFSEKENIDNNGQQLLINFENNFFMQKRNRQKALNDEQNSIIQNELKNFINQKKIKFI